jgi:hypothetical protein
MRLKNSGKCIDAKGASRNNGVKLLQWDCKGGDNQLVRVTGKVMDLGSIDWCYRRGNGLIQSVPIIRNEAVTKWDANHKGEIIFWCHSGKQHISTKFSLPETMVLSPKQTYRPIINLTGCTMNYDPNWSYWRNWAIRHPEDTNPNNESYETPVFKGQDIANKMCK